MDQRQLEMGLWSLNCWGASPTSSQPHRILAVPFVFGEQGGGGRE